MLQKFKKTSMKWISYQISTSYNELYLFNSGISGGGRERKRERERERKREINTHTIVQSLTSDCEDLIYYAIWVYISTQ